MELPAFDPMRHSPWVTLLILGLVLGEFFWLRWAATRSAGPAAQATPRYDRPHDLRETAATFGIVLGQILLRGATATMILPIIGFAADHRLMQIEMTDPIAWPPLLVLVDFVYYWFHRCSHLVAWMWASHVVHHSSSRFNLTSAYRLGWTGLFSGGWVFFMLPVWIGFPPGAVATAVAFNLTYQLLLHTTLIGRLGPLEWVLNTPTHHRVHHAANTACLDRNFGGILIVFDRLFGTFATAPQDEPLRYGTTLGQAGYNPIRIAFNGWIALLEKARRAGSLRGVLAVLLGRP
ncbi:sterol desaturase family protein [Dongia sedimenti]|uniref:Sterol desaturase family protein n=1 Tax=Dongia sedimenti TaxID=3064282 RepID=A0ABU0YTT6_9PROT|nr:sterol desaturase family protein [Rhodospirillaceae bacterium R-7]